MPNVPRWSPSLVSFSTTAALWIAYELFVPSRSAAKVAHIANQLNVFAARDQLAIELLPPTLPLLSRLGYSTDSLRLSHALGHGSGLFAIQCLLHVLAETRHTATLLVADILSVISVLCTWDWSSLVSYWLVCSLTRVVLFGRDVSRTNAPLIWLCCRLLVTLTVITVCQLAVMTIGLSLCLGKSEVAFGGNYNLRYLDAEWRRGMRPAFEIPTTLNASGPGLHSMTPYSFYIPSAGFLWSDKSTWSSELGTFVNQEFASDTLELADSTSRPLGHRVIMKDPIGRFTPWILQKDLGHSLHNGLEQEVFLHREPVVLRSAESKHFLAVSSDPSLLEDELNNAESGRFSVFMSPSYIDDDVLFELRRITASSFQLYHPQHSCSLATTFRSFPDRMGYKLNDSMLHELHQELEVACVQKANAQSSTIFIVDGYENDDASKMRASNHIIHHLRRGMAIMSAMRRVGTFRKLHHELQHTPTEMLFESSDAQGAGSTALLLCILCLALYKQRTGQSRDFWMSSRGQQLLLITGVGIVQRTEDAVCLPMFAMLILLYRSHAGREDGLS